jgi:hypothetical protein
MPIPPMLPPRKAAIPHPADTLKVSAPGVCKCAWEMPAFATSPQAFPCEPGTWPFNLMMAKFLALIGTNNLRFEETFIVSPAPNPQGKPWGFGVLLALLENNIFHQIIIKPFGFYQWAGFIQIWVTNKQNGKYLTFSFLVRNIRL